MYIWYTQCTSSIQLSFWGVFRQSEDSHMHNTVLSQVQETGWAFVAWDGKIFQAENIVWKHHNECKTPKMRRDGQTLVDKHVTKQRLRKLIPWLSSQTSLAGEALDWGISSILRSLGFLALLITASPLALPRPLPHGYRCCLRCEQLFTGFSPLQCSLKWWQAGILMN